jgi:hypothetical protein
MRDIFYPAFETFLLRERDNILNGVSERNLCARLAVYLEQAKDRAGLDRRYFCLESHGIQIPDTAV